MRKFKSGLDIGFLESGVSLEDFWEGVAVFEQVQDSGNRNASAFDDWFTDHDGGVDLNSVIHNKVSVACFGEPACESCPIYRTRIIDRVGGVGQAFVVV